MPSAAPDRPTIAIIGGTGPEGRGLALRLAQLGYPVVIGSRSAERASATVGELRGVVPAAQWAASENEPAAQQGEIVILSVPYGGIARTLRTLREAVRGKLVVSTITPISFESGRMVVVRPESGSAAQEVQAALPDSRVVSAFQTVDAYHLQNVPESLDTDVVVCSDDADARHRIMDLARELPGVRAWSGGRLAASRYVEELTALLITLNRIHKVHSGVRFTDLGH